METTNVNAARELLIWYSLASYAICLLLGAIVVNSAASKRAARVSKAPAYLGILLLAPLSWPFVLLGFIYTVTASRASRASRDERSIDGKEICKAEEHYHRDDRGFLHACYHKAKTNYVGFFVGMTVSFPFEHYLYEKVWPFTLITKWLLG